MKLKLVGQDNPKLSSPCKMVKEEDYKKAIKFAKRMLSFLDNTPNGVGLSANQVGRTDNIFVINYMGLKEIFINCAILGKEGKKIWMKEGCLSYPGKEKVIRRRDIVEIIYFDGKKTVQVKVNRMLSRIIQHEMDHIHGECKVK